MSDTQLDQLRDILKHVTVNEAFDLAIRYVRSLPRGNMSERVMRDLELETVRFLRDFVRT